MDSFKDQKFSLMDNLDSLTDKEVKDLGDKSPKAMIKSTINSIKNSITSGDCNVAKDIAIKLKNGTVERYSGILAITLEEIEIVSKLIVMAEDCIKKQGIDAIDAQIDHIVGLIESGKDGRGNCTEAKKAATELLNNEGVTPEQEKDINFAINRAKTCMVSYELAYQKKLTMKEDAEETLKTEDWYNALLVEYDIALNAFNLDTPKIWNFSDTCEEATKTKFNKLAIVTQNNRSNVVLSDRVYSNSEKEIISNLDDQVDYFKNVCNMRGNEDCQDPNPMFSSLEFFQFTNISLQSGLEGIGIYPAYLLEKSQCHKNKDEFLNSWKGFVNLKKNEGDKKLYSQFLDEYIEMLNEELLDYTLARNDPDDVEQEIRRLGGEDNFKSANKIGCPDGYGDYEDEILECANFNFYVVNNFLGTGSNGLNILEGIEENDKLWHAVNNDWVKDSVLCWINEFNNDNCASCRYEGKATNCRSYSDLSCDFDPCRLTLENKECYWRDGFWWDNSCDYRTVQ